MATDKKKFAEDIAKAWIENFKPIQPSAAYEQYKKEMAKRLFGSLGVPESILQGQATFSTHSTGQTASIKYEDLVDVMHMMKPTSYEKSKQQAKDKYKTNYDNIFPETSTRPAYQGPVVHYDGKKSPYQQKKDDETRQKVYAEAQKKVTLRFVYARDCYTGDFRLDHVRRVPLGDTR